MIIKTIAADRQLAEGFREESLTKEATSKPVEKSYLRSQFERRQKRQIGLTNKMHRHRSSGESAESERRQHQQQQPEREDQPDLAVRSHELIKRRFFEELERRESINSARVAATHKQGKLHQQQRQHTAADDQAASLLFNAHWPHHNQLQPIAQLCASPSMSKQACDLGQVDINEPDGAGTDADEATSLETIITNDPESSIVAPSSPPPTTIAGSLYGALSRQAPPLDNSVPGQQVELREDTSDGHDDVGASTRFSELANVEQTGQFQATTRSSSTRQPSKAEDLQDRARPTSDCEQGKGELHRRSMFLQQHQREQYANPGPSDDSARGSYESESRVENNVNHDQYDGHHEILKGSQVSTQAQVIVGMQLNQFAEGGKEGRGINLPESRGHRRCSTSGRDLVSSNERQLLHHSPLQREDSLSQPSNQSQIVQAQASQQQAMACNDGDSCEIGQHGEGDASFLVDEPSPVDRGAQEEDARSSCSSSGFGASVSTGSSAASSSSEGHRGHGHHRNRHLHIDRRSQADDAVTNNSCNDGQLPQCSQVELSADEIAQFEIVVGRLDGVADLNNVGEQTLSVGPERSRRQNQENDDQDDGAYCKMLHVENHGYGSLDNSENRISATRTKTIRNQTDKRRWPLVNPDDLSNELDLYLSRQYVNLPADDYRDSCEPAAPYSMEAAANVGYATVRARTNPVNNSNVNLVRGQTSGGCNVGLANTTQQQQQPTGANNGNLTSRNPDGALIKLNHFSSSQPPPPLQLAAQRCDGTDECGSEHNSSTGSSGGFSKLPPVRLIDHNFANNFQSSTSATAKAALSSSSRPIEESNSLERAASQLAKKSPSLLKRFGSLVSRAFTSANSPSGEFSSRGNANCSNRGRSGAHLNSAELEDPLSERQRSLPTENPKGRPHSSGGVTNDGGIPSLREHKSMASERRETTQRDNQDQSSNQSQGQANASASHQLRENKSPATCSSKSLAVAEADLVILSGKHSRDHHQATRTKRPVMLVTVADLHRQHGAAKSRSSRRLEELPLGGGRQNEKLIITKEKCCPSKNAQHHSKSRTSKSVQEFIERFSALRSTSSASCSSFTSLDDSSTSLSSMRNRSHRDGNGAKRLVKERPRSHPNNLGRASSLSDLESLISPSEVGSSQQNFTDEPDSVRNKYNLARVSKMAFDHNEKLHPNGCESSKSRRRTRWFSVTGSNGCSSTNEDSTSIQCEPLSWASSGRTLRESNRPQPKSLIDHNHASSDYKLSTPLASNKGSLANLCSKLQPRFKSATKQQSASPIYTSPDLARRSPLRGVDKEIEYQRGGQLCMQPDGTCVAFDNGGDLASNKLRDDELVVNDGKCQSLNLYQNLLRTYVKRRGHQHQHRHHRHHGGGGHHHSHHHHHHHRHASNSSHHHHHHRSSSSRHAHCSSSASRCGQQQRCSSPTCAHFGDQQQTPGATKVGPASGKSRGNQYEAGVWGQLIKIKKSDGSQVIELQRNPDKSWGFFVARGAINKTKGIFISRMHNSSTGNSLSGLLSVGDRILSIDNHAIEPEFDILRVNQMISKKSKIHLEVKPFKG